MNEERILEPYTPYVSQEGFVTVDLLRGFDEVRRLYNAMHDLNGGCFICGGYARWCASPSPDKNGLPGDVDIYSPSEAAFTRARDFLKVTGHLGIKHENDLAITYAKPSIGPFVYTPVIQLIKPIKEGRVVAVGSKEDVLSNFDFSVVRAAILNQESVLVDADFMHDEQRKILRLKNIHCPISSTLRCMKYSAKGYWLPPKQVLKLFLDWDDRDDRYKGDLIGLINKADAEGGLTKEEINELEAMMRRD